MNWSLKACKRAGKVLFVLILLVGLAQLAAPAPAALGADLAVSSYIVNTTADPGPAACTTSTCSLRAAITAANTGGASGTNTITFNLTYPATITLSSALPAVVGTLTVTGPGAGNLVIDGNGLYRGFNVSSTANLTLTGLTIRQGYDDVEGGAIFVDHGTLALANVTIDDSITGGGNGGGVNSAGGKVSIASSTFSNNGGFHDGAIANSGVMTVTDTYFLNNRTRVGGAIENATGGTLTVTNSTFSGNVASISSGGAILNGGTLVVANSTFYNNGSIMGADIYNAGPSANITNSTFSTPDARSGSSVENAGGTLTLRNSILDSGLGVDNCVNTGTGTLTAGASNLSTDNTCGSATITTSALLKLGSLQYHGGFTPVIAPLAGSSAINTGDATVCAAAVGSPTFGAGGKDQRGFTRPQGVRCDVGAVEFLNQFNYYLPFTAR